jgi:hypothetical protein
VARRPDGEYRGPVRSNALLTVLPYTSRRVSRPPAVTSQLCLSEVVCCSNVNEFEVDVEFLISLVEERPVLWDKTSEEYKDKNLTLAAWTEICAKLKEGFESLDEKGRNEIGKFALISYFWKLFISKFMSRTEHYN